MEDAVQTAVKHEPWDSYSSHSLYLPATCSGSSGSAFELVTAPALVTTEQPQGTIFPIGLSCKPQYAASLSDWDSWVCREALRMAASARLRYLSSLSATHQLYPHHCPDVNKVAQDWLTVVHYYGQTLSEKYGTVIGVRPQNETEKGEFPISRNSRIHWDGWLIPTQKTPEELLNPAWLPLSEKTVVTDPREREATIRSLMYQPSSYFCHEVAGWEEQTRLASYSQDQGQDGTASGIFIKEEF